MVRGLLEAGDLRPSNGEPEVEPMDLARRFRDLRIGWGRDRYLGRIDRWLRRLDEAPPGRHESPGRSMELLRLGAKHGQIGTVALDEIPIVNDAEPGAVWHVDAAVRIDAVDRV